MNDKDRKFKRLNFLSLSFILLTIIIIFEMAEKKTIG